MATAIGSLGIPLGCVIGFVAPSFFINGEEGAPKTLANFNTYLYVQNFFSVIPCLSALLLIRSKPPTPSSFEKKKSVVNSKLNFG